MKTIIHSLWIAITHNHVFSKSPGQTITHPSRARNNHALKNQSRFRCFPWSHNHADNHANHAEPITLGPPSLQEGGVQQPVVLPHKTKTTCRLSLGPLCGRRLVVPLGGAS